MKVRRGWRWWLYLISPRTFIKEMLRAHVRIPRPMHTAIPSEAPRPASVNKRSGLNKAGKWGFVFHLCTCAWHLSICIHTHEHAHTNQMYTQSDIIQVVCTYTFIKRIFCFVFYHSNKYGFLFFFLLPGHQEVGNVAPSYSPHCGVSVTTGHKAMGQGMTDRNLWNHDHQ